MAARGEPGKVGVVELVERLATVTTEETELLHRGAGEGAYPQG